MTIAEVAALLGASAATASAILQWIPVMERIASSKDMKEIYEAMSEGMRMLRAKRDDYQNIIQRNRIQRPSRTYEEWGRMVMNIEDQVKRLKTIYEKKKKSKFHRLSSNFIEEMKKIGEKIDELWEKGDQLGEVCIDQAPEPVVKIKTPKISNFSSLQKPLNYVRSLLTRDHIKGVGIWGPIGIGKTTIMENLNNDEGVANTFDMVLWLKVSTEGSKNNLSIEHLQRAILRRLKVDMINTDHPDEFAHCIYGKLKDKRYLLLLDDVKQNLDLNQIGFPDGDMKGSKIVLTTRIRDVCATMVEILVKVEKLKPIESLNMFKNILNRPDLDNINISRLMRQVVNECGGFPLMIKTVASAYKTRDTEDQWNVGVKNLKKFPTKEDQAINEFYRYLSVCCDHLNDWQKNCFLFGALYPEDEDIYIDCLLDCWAAENLLPSDNVREEGIEILGQLKNVSLLEEGKNGQYVMMHKSIRQMALYILSLKGERKFLVKTSEALQTTPDAEHWKDKNWISLVDNKLNKIPDSPHCPKLSTLLLQKNPTLKEVPSSFFEHMSGLRVLDLYHTGIRSLPSTLSKLAILRVLYLSACKDLRELPTQIGEVQHLQVLDIRGSGIHSIPSHICNLIRLRRLLVSFTNFENQHDNQDVINSCNEISKLSTLEELFIEVNSVKELCGRMLSHVIREVATLTKLTTLRFCFLNETIDVIKEMGLSKTICVPNADILGYLLEKRNDLLRRSFEVFIGCQISRSPQIPESYEYERYVIYCNGEGSNNAISQVLANADAFELVNYKDTEHRSKFDIRSMDQVRGCLIQSCHEMKTIVDDGNETAILPNLEWFYINDLPKLESIWGGLLPSGSLSNLKTLVLNRCPMLKKICSDGVIQQLCEVQQLTIEDCSAIEDVIKAENVGVYPCVLPKLEELLLLDLPKLKCIWGGPLQSGSLSKLETLVLKRCPMLIKIFSDGVIQQLCEVRQLQIEDCSAIEEVIKAENVGVDPCVLPKLEKLLLCNLPNLKSIWGGPLPSGSLSKLETLVLKGCPMLIKIFSDGVIQQLCEVRRLKIKDCSAIVEVITVEVVGVHCALLKLEELVLCNLPNLKRIWGCPLKSVSLSKLKTLVLKGCPMLIKIFSDGVIQLLCEVQQLTIEDCSAIVEVITAKTVYPDVLPKLKELVLLDLTKLKRIWAKQSLKWPSLEMLEIQRCPELKTLPFSKDNALKLKSIKIEQGCWKALQWQHVEVKERLHPYCTFS